ncbi:MAG: integrase arm-type DNA-binding domain-containing protein, partial [Paracoccaceae bacterium]|nr:integrase arm-type DNA-binding domain-containing protein [Paracoccaceae bacterium]
MAKALTPNGIEALKPGRDRREIPDPSLSGLYIVVQPTGAKSWAVRYRFNGKPSKLTLGRWPIMGLADARRAAGEALVKVEAGINPAAEKKAEKAARKAAGEDADADRNKVLNLIEQYYKRHLSTIRSGNGVLAAMMRYVVHDGAKALDRRATADLSKVPLRWGDREIQSITKRDVIELLDDIVDTGTVTTANRVRAYLSGFFNWCIGRDVIDLSPMSGVKAPAKEKSRDRVLSDDEVRWFWLACEKVGAPWEQFAKSLLLTGQRLNEVAKMSEDELRGDMWHLPASRTKNQRPHDVPLSDAVRGILDTLPRIVGRDSRSRGLIFSTNGKSAISGFSKTRNNIHDAMLEIAQEELVGVEIPRWTFHDLRRTAATGMARLGIPLRVTEAVLNHVSGSGAGIVSVYQRHDFADEKRAALEAWAGFVDRIVNGTP